MTQRSAPPFVVIPEFRVRPQVRTAFLDAALDDARHSLADEAGCRRFDVVCPEGAEDTVLFYEVYDDRTAFDAYGMRVIPRFARSGSSSPFLRTRPTASPRSSM